MRSACGRGSAVNHCTIPILTEEAFPVDGLDISIISACPFVFNYFDDKFLKFTIIHIYMFLFINAVCL